MDNYEWLKLFRTQRRFRNREIAEIAGVDSGTLSNQIAQKKIKPETFERLKAYEQAHPLEINNNEIISKSGNSDLTPPDTRVIIKTLEETLREGEELLKTLYAHTVKLPLIGSIPADHFGDSMTDVTEFYEMPAAHAINADAVARISGDCMSPTLQHDDLVTIHFQHEAKHGDMVLVRNEEGAVTIKRYSLKRGIASLVPDNPSYVALTPNFGTIIAVVLGIVMRRF